MTAFLFTLWLNLSLPPCERTVADPERVVTVVERDGTSVVYDGMLEAFYSTRLGAWRFYRTDSPFTVPESALLALFVDKIERGDTASLTYERPSWCSLPPSRARG